MVDIDSLAEAYWKAYDPTYEDDDIPDEGETLSHIKSEIKRLFEDLTAEQYQIAQDNTDEILQYVEEILS